MKITQKLLARMQNPWDNDPVVIVCLGDSVTHGCFEVFWNEQGNLDTEYRVQCGYAKQLERTLCALYPAAAPTVINAGISGDTATGALKRLDRDVLRFKPDLVTVNFGLNDCTEQDFDKNLRQYKKSMTAIFEKVLAAGSECMLVTPNFKCEYVSHIFTDDRLREIAAEQARHQTQGLLDQYVDTARRCAWASGVPVADAYAKWQALKKSGVDTTKLLANRINHPTEEAHRMFVEAITDVLFA